MKTITLTLFLVISFNFFSQQCVEIETYSWYQSECLGISNGNGELYIESDGGVYLSISNFQSALSPYSWSTSGSGSFTITSDSTATYYPSNSELLMWCQNQGPETTITATSSINTSCSGSLLAVFWSESFAYSIAYDGGIEVFHNSESIYAGSMISIPDTIFVDICPNDSLEIISNYGGCVFGIYNSGPIYSSSNENIEISFPFEGAGPCVITSDNVSFVIKTSTDNCEFGETTLYGCPGDSIPLPRFRVIEPGCVDSNLINHCAIYTNIIAPTCGCDQVMYHHYDIGSIAGLTSTGDCSSQLSYWSSDGSGSFSNYQDTIFFAGSPTTHGITYYYPSLSDLSNGVVNLHFNVNGISSQQITLLFIEGPKLENDRLICGSSPSIQLNALSSNLGGFGGLYDGTWSGGQGTYNPSNTVVDPTYTPTSDELNNGVVELIYNADYIQGTCAVDTIRYFFDTNLSSNASVDAGPDILNCSSPTLINLNANSSNCANYIWNGYGSFNPNNDLSSIYSPSNFESSFGHGRLSLIGYDNNNCSVMDILNYHFTNTAKIRRNLAGMIWGMFADTNSTVSLEGSITGQSNGVIWSSSSNGSFSNPNSLNTDYTFNSNDISNGRVWIYFQNLGCNNPVDSIELKLMTNSNLDVSFSNFLDTMICGQTIQIPFTSIEVTGYVNWATIANPNGASSGMPGCLSLNYTLDGQSIPNNGNEYVIGPLDEGSHMVEVFLTQEINPTSLLVDSYEIIVIADGSNEVISGCDSFSWTANGQTYTESGQYTEVLINQSGCDSTVTLDLTINSSSSSTQTQTGIDSYTWPVNNETYTESGTYTTVIPNAVGCDSTITLDLTLEFTGLDENELSYVAVYPNPTYNSFTLSTKDMINMNYTLLDIQGKVVLTGKIESPEETVDISNLSRGQYNLVFEDESISPISIIKN